MRDERQSYRDYTPEAFERVRQALLHVATVLGDWMDPVTLIGGVTLRNDGGIWVYGSASCVVLKAMAIRNREKAKDAYDLHYILANLGEGIPAVASSLEGRFLYQWLDAIGHQAPPGRADRGSGSRGRRRARRVAGRTQGLQTEGHGKAGNHGDALLAGGVQPTGQNDHGTSGDAPP
jgi:hypothetical protein